MLPFNNKIEYRFSLGIILHFITFLNSEHKKTNETVINKYDRLMSAFSYGRFNIDCTKVEREIHR